MLKNKKKDEFKGDSLLVNSAFDDCYFGKIDWNIDNDSIVQSCELFDILLVEVVDGVGEEEANFVR